MVFHRITLLEYTTIYIFFLLSWDVLVFFHLLLLSPLLNNTAVDILCVFLRDMFKNVSRGFT